MNARLLVWAPHPDDEILGCTGLMTRMAQCGGAVKVVVVTGGQLGGDASIRAAETQQGLASLGLPPAEQWECPDGALPLDAATQDRYRTLVQAFKPTHLALPSPAEAHADHRRLTRGLLNALTGNWSGVLVFYETTTPLAQCNHFEPLVLADKLHAMGQHASQLASFNYLQWITGLSALRGAFAGCEAAEGYLTFEWDGSPQNFFEHQPLVSIVIRADDAALLAHALHSVEAQTYDQVEVWVIWHGNLPPPLPASLMAQVLRGPGGRSANLNMGLEHARGEYVVFLDQDDVLHPEHLATLVTELQADPRIDLAYGNHERVTCSREGDAVHVQQRHLIEAEPFRPGRLMLGNHIPLHSHMCRLRRAQHIRFDEQLGAYEDWDFLLRAELDGWHLRHIDVNVCEYRLYPASEQSAELHVLHESKGYQTWTPAIRHKLFDQLQRGQLDTLLDFAEDMRSQLDALQQQHTALTLTSEATQATLAEARQQQRDLHDWADALVPGTVGLSPVARLSGQAMRDGPTVSVLMPVCDPDPGFFTEAVHSVIQQSYPHWELCLADDASTSPTIRAMLAHLVTTDGRIRLVTHTDRQGIVAATTSACALARGSWLTFVDHDDRLHPDALLEMVKAVRANQATQAIYSDSDTVDRNGNRINSFLKPAWSPETLLHLSYMNHLSMVRRDVFEHIGGLTPGLDGCQDWDMWLRLSLVPGLHVTHVPKSLYDWRASETSTAYSLASKPYVIEAAHRATQAHLQRLGATEVSSWFPTNGVPGIRHRWTAPQLPLTVIVLTHNNPTDLARLLSALQASTYPALHIELVANRVSPTDADTHRLLSEAATWPNTHVSTDDRAFNWAALNNAAARRCTTPWMLFLNDDVEWAEPDTLQHLTRYLALDAAIGIVGMRLMYGAEEGGDIQHDGIVTTTVPRRVAHNIRSAVLTAGLNMPRNVSAVTGACMLTTQDVFKRCGGFDERFPVSFNDVDFCLHARQLGYRIVQASDVSGIHHESRTRGLPDTPDKLNEIIASGQRLHDRWGDFLTEQYSLTYEREFVSSHIVHIPRTAS